MMIKTVFSEIAKYCSDGMMIKTMFFGEKAKYSSVGMMVKAVFSKPSS